MTLPNNLVKLLIKMYQEFRNVNNVLSAKDFTDQILEGHRLSEEEANTFLDLVKHQSLVDTLAEHFMRKNFLKHLNSAQVEVLIYIIIFVLEQDNSDEVLNSFLQINCSYLPDLLASFLQPDKHLFLCQAACKYFEDDYVLEKIIYPFLNKLPVILALADKAQKLKEIKAKPPTKPRDITVYTKRIPPPPSNTPLLRYHFKANPVPESTRKRHVATEKRILRLHKDNRKKAEELLQQAKKVSARLTQLGKKEHQQEETVPKLFKVKPAPVFKEIQIKGTLATTLREASRIIKSQEEDVRKIDELFKGGCATESLEKIQEELKKEKELQQLETIERNHLKGLLSYEEAILAKKRLIEANKEKMEAFKEERVKLIDALIKWREEQEQGIKSKMEKIHTIKTNVKKNELMLLEKKQVQARLQQYETQQLLQQAYEDQMRELERKAQIIQEIKTLHQVRCNIKEFDPTEAPNLGLLCEMSIAELQERLALAKMKMQEELEEKRRTIAKGREERRMMVENVKNLIAQTKRAAKPKLMPSGPTKLEQNPDLIELRKLLEEKRRLRNAL